MPHMIFVRSSPWMVKVAILLMSALKSNKEESADTTLIVKTFLAVSLYFIVMIVPSLMCTVRNRADTTEFIQLSSLMLGNLYVVLCLCLSDKIASKQISLILQLMIFHIFYNQSRYLVEKHHVIHYSSLFKYLNLLLSMAVISMLTIKTPGISFLSGSDHDVIISIMSIFLGELLGCISFAQYIATKVVSEVYEKSISSIFFL